MSAPSSGHGKTAIAVGLLAALSARNVPTAGFKVGPDHTDAAYLGLAAGRPGRNLDPRLVGAQRVAPLFAHGAAGTQLSVIEGAMGLFDSLTGQPELDGTAAVAASLRAPVVLVVDVASMGHSLAALVHGFRMFDEMVQLGGVILNRVASPRHEQMLRSAMDDIGMPVLGALHRGDLPNVLPARTHGLVPVAHRTVEAGRAVRRLGEAISTTLDMDRLMAIANSAPPVPGSAWNPADAAGDPVTQRPLIALAGGQGAPYTYVETAELLTAAGADVAVVDPLRDEALPPGTRALIVGAGLPEGYAEELSANHRLSSAVAQFARDGWPVVAEGIALPWLGRELDGRPMCGVLDITASTGDQTVAGYREATAPSTSLLAPAGARITGYKQHRAVVAPRAGSVPAWTWSGGNPEGFVWRQVHASQLGLHWAAAPEIAKRLVVAAVAGPPSGPQSGPQPGPPSGPPSGPQPGPGSPSGPPSGPPSGGSQPGPPSGSQGSSGQSQQGVPTAILSTQGNSMPSMPSGPFPAVLSGPPMPPGPMPPGPMLPGPMPGSMPSGPMPGSMPGSMPPGPMPGSMPGSMPPGPMPGSMTGSMPPGPMPPGMLPPGAMPGSPPYPDHQPGPPMAPRSAPHAPHDQRAPMTYGPDQVYTPDQIYTQDQVYTPDQVYAQDQGYGPEQAYGPDQAYVQDQAYSQDHAYTQDHVYAQDQAYVQDQSYGPDQAYGQDQVYGPGPGIEVGFGPGQGMGYAPGMPPVPAQPGPGHGQQNPQGKPPLQVPPMPPGMVPSGGPGAVPSGGPGTGHGPGGNGNPAPAPRSAPGMHDGPENRPTSDIPVHS
ncbi:cobyrinate a,c-diamide synthase [Actinoplanes sp. NBRC 101535]|uniref:cobyrinate a,c-diamide synthase n=1 Tax=Actinoplanes sp. NBRC 101535 TaxID=3032196 RepID=UPI0025577E0E|nr:cobyrinate a,c-diamide synthase [Actinoplanes sp. NBRC 101535]